MSKNVKSFQELSKSEWAMAGGKGGTLSRLYQAGYPVPDGFVILPPAFMGHELSQDGWLQVQASLAETRNDHQLATADYFEKAGYLMAVRETADLAPALERLESFQPSATIEGAASPELLHRLREFAFGTPTRTSGRSQ